MTFVLILMLLVAVVVGTYVLCYNSLMAARFRVDEAWSGITVQLKRRHALVPNLVQAARTALGHEQSIVDKIISARAAALEAMATDRHPDIAKAEAGLSQALGQLFAYTEDNPEITANENLALLQKTAGRNGRPESLPPGGSTMAMSRLTTPGPPPYPGILWLALTG